MTDPAKIIRPQIILRLSRPLTLLNARDRMHWSKKRAEKNNIAWEIRAQIQKLPAQPIEKSSVTVWRHSVQIPDQDNLQASVKSLLDVLQPNSKKHPFGLGIIAGDDPAHCKILVFHMRATTFAAQHTLIRIVEL